MLFDATKDMQRACEQWLRAREQFRRRTGRAALDEYCRADHYLFAAFARDWSNSDGEVLCAAYSQFRKMLVEQYERARLQHRNDLPWLTGL